MFIWCKAMTTFNWIELIITWIFSSVGGGAVTRVDPDSTGLHPSWRNALSEIVIETTWRDNSSTIEFSQQINRLKQSTIILDQLTTDSASYLNEVLLFFYKSCIIILRNEIMKPFFWSRLLVMNSISRNLSLVLITINWDRSKTSMILILSLLFILV